MSDESSGSQGVEYGAMDGLMDVVRRQHFLTDEQTWARGRLIVRGRVAQSWLDDNAARLDAGEPSAFNDSELAWLHRDVRRQEAAENVLISTNLPRVVSIAKRYKSAVHFLDRVQFGAMGLMRAVAKFDWEEEKGRKFVPYIKRGIHLYIKQGIREEHRRMISQQVVDFLYEIDQHTDRLRLEGIPPTVEVLSERTGISEDNIERALLARQRFGVTISTNDPMPDDEEVGTLIEDADLRDPADRAADFLYTQEVLSLLTDQERRVLALKTMYQLTDQEIADRLNLKKDNTRYIRLRAINKILAHPKTKQFLEEMGED